MKARLVCIGGAAAVLLLAAGCRSTEPAAPRERLAHVESTSQQILDDLLTKAGMSGANLVLETTLTFPVPPDGDHNPVPAWRGVLKDQVKAALQADDQVLVIAKSLQCNAVEARYVFNPFTRTWLMASDDAPPEGNWVRVLFQGTVRDFAREVEAARSRQGPLSSLAKPAAAAAEAVSFPLALTIADLRGSLATLGLSALDAHLKAEHATSSCNPDVHVYLKSAAAK